MKHVALSAAVLVSTIMPLAPTHAASASATAKQAICQPMVITLPDGTEVEGQFCYSQGGRV